MSAPPSSRRAPDAMRRLSLLDAAHRADHAFLGADDCCAFLAEYPAGRSYRSGGVHQLIGNFKIQPAVARVSPRRESYKRQAIVTMARWLRQAVTRTEAEQCTWVPVPPSRRCDDPDFDDRLSRTLRLAFDTFDIDVRGLLYQTESTARDHLAARRLSAEALYGVLRVDLSALGSRPVRERIALFDDVLTTGKHYKCCERRLREVLPCRPISGVFLLRRILRRHPPPTF